MILNRQRAVRLARRRLEVFLTRVRQELGLGEGDVTVCLVSDAEIARMNEAYRKKKGPTDVLSFPEVKRRAPTSLRRARRGPAASGARRAKFLGDVAISASGAGRGEFLGDVAISPA